MNKIKQLFCKHTYKKRGKRTSDYCSDVRTFRDLYWYDDIQYICKKCGKQKIKIVRNESHPGYSPWKKEV